MTTILMLTLNDLRAISTLRHVTEPDRKAREAVPALAGIRITVSPHEWRAIATDKFIAAELRGDRIPESPEVGLDPDEQQRDYLVHDRDFERLVKQLAALEPKPRGDDIFGLTFDTERGLVRVGIDQPTPGPIPLLGHAFPPVERLFPDERDLTGEVSQVALSPEKLARLGKVRTPAEMAHAPKTRARGYALNLRFRDDWHRGAVSTLVTRGGAIGTDGSAFRGLMRTDVILDH